MPSRRRNKLCSSAILGAGSAAEDGGSSNFMYNGLPTSIVIFGASGDLAQRKLVPSLFNL
jgi:hypothetical protein